MGRMKYTYHEESKLFGSFRVKSVCNYLQVVCRLDKHSVTAGISHSGDELI